jgi:WNK lysine deficient protein kinase
MRLEVQHRQQLILLMQRQQLEEEELRLRHYMELEKFQKGLGK